MVALRIQGWWQPYGQETKLSGEHRENKSENGGGGGTFLVTEAGYVRTGTRCDIVIVWHLGFWRWDNWIFNLARKYPNSHINCWDEMTLRRLTCN